MPLPDISGYLAATRQPLDLVGPAIAAFQAVSSEMRATRAQNQSEEESARDLGKGIKEGMQKDRMFEENIIDMHQMRDLRDQEMQMEQLRFAMDMRQQEFEYQNLLPLEVQSRQLGIARQQQLFNAASQEMQTEHHLMNLGVENLSRVGTLMAGGGAVPQEAIDTAAGETAESPQARIRAVSRQLDIIGPLIQSTGNKGLAAQYQNHRRLLEADPGFQALRSSDRLMLPAEREERRTRRVNAFKAMLPFDDAGTVGFIERNHESVMAMLDMPDAEYEMINRRLLSRADSEYKSEMDGLNPSKAPGLGQGAINSIASAAAEVEAAQAELNAMQKGKKSDDFRLLPLKSRVSAAEARYSSLLRQYGTMVPGAILPSQQSATKGGTSIEDFYR